VLESRPHRSTPPAGYHLVRDLIIASTREHGRLLDSAAAHPTLFADPT
jgi:hypothetical protein